MGFFGDILDIAVDIATDTVKTGAKVTDAVLDTDFDGALEKVKDVVKMKD